jgi:hypothetical protein
MGWVAAKLHLGANFVVSSLSFLACFQLGLLSAEKCTWKSTRWVYRLASLIYQARDMSTKEVLERQLKIDVELALRFI